MWCGFSLVGNHRRHVGCYLITRGGRYPAHGDVGPVIDAVVVDVPLGGKEHFAVAAIVVRVPVIERPACAVEVGVVEVASGVVELACEAPVLISHGKSIRVPNQQDVSDPVVVLVVGYAPLDLLRSIDPGVDLIERLQTDKPGRSAAREFETQQRLQFVHEVVRGEDEYPVLRKGRRSH